MVVIYPVVELADLIYGHRYNWLRPLAEVTNGIMLRPEPLLGRIYRGKLTIRKFLNEQYSIPMDVLAKLSILLDHGIMSSDFATIFGLEKTPQNIVDVYIKLGIDYGLSFDVPARLYISVAIDKAADMILGNDIDAKTKISKVFIDPSVSSIVTEVAKYLAETMNTHHIVNIANNASNSRAKDSKTLKMMLRRELSKRVKGILEKHSDGNLYELLKRLSATAVNETIARFKTMLKIANHKGFKGLVPVVQGLFEEDVVECAESLIEIYYSECNAKSITIAIGTGGRNLSKADVRLIEIAIDTVHSTALRCGIKAKIHLLGWSSPKNLHEPKILERIHSADSLSSRRRAIEGKIYLFDGNEIKLVHVSTIRRNEYKCNCPVCRDPVLRNYVLDPSGARRNDARIVHNVYVLVEYINRISFG